VHDAVKERRLFLVLRLGINGAIVPVLHTSSGVVLKQDTLDTIFEIFTA
jgi:hypothetical protein